MAKAKKPTWKVDGLDFTKKKFKKANLSFLLEKASGPPSVCSFGTPITRRAADEMIRTRKWDKWIADYKAAKNQRMQAGLKKESQAERDILDKRISVTFSKEILLFLMAQQRCAGIKFYFCVNQDNAESLVLIAVDENNNDLNCPKGTIVPLKGETLSLTGGADEGTLGVEVGGPKLLRDVIDQVQLMDSAYDKALNQYFTQQLR